MADADNSKPLIGDLTGAGEIINSPVAEWTYKDGLSPAVKQVGALSADTLKSLRLFTAPLQLFAAYQDRFEGFCQRVRERVPESEQREAAPEIARPVMEAFASTSDDGPTMSMFEELMAKAIDKREADTLSPQFPKIIQTLSPLQALLISQLHKSEQYTDDILDLEMNSIVQRVGANFDFESFGGQAHHLTISLDLKSKELVTILQNKETPPNLYPKLKVPEGRELKRTIIRLSMFGRWFAEAVTPKSEIKERVV